MPCPGLHNLMKLLKWIVVGILLGLTLLLARQTHAQDTPSCVKTTLLMPFPGGEVGSGVSSPRLLLLYPLEIEKHTPFYPLRVWLVMGGVLLTWVDRFPIGLNLPPGEYTVVISHQFGVDVIPLRVGLPEIPNFAFSISSP